MAPADMATVRRRIAGLRRRAELQPLARIARRHGVAVWIVGGAIRDRALGLPIPEVDVAVSGDAEALARELELEGRGRAVFLSRDRPGPRVFRVAGKRPVDIAEVEGGSILADLARRDFTVNAVAVGLDSGFVVDPFGGLSDLAARRLRAVQEANLVEDPLRALRAARLLATHGLHPDPGALAAARRAAPLLARTAPERVAAELSKLLASETAGPALCWAARAGVLSSAFGRRLSPACAAGLARAVAAWDGRSTRTLAPERRRRLRLALLAARLGLSEGEARRWTRERRWGRREGEEVSRLVGLAAAARRVHATRDAWRWVLDAGTLAEDALRLLARIAPRSRSRAALLRRLARSPLRKVRVDGNDVVGWLGVAPGPAVGALLAELRVAVAMGEVKNRREARDWLSGQVRRSL